MHYKDSSYISVRQDQLEVCEYPDCDVHSSSETYAERFTGPLGAYFLERQWSIVKKGLPQGKKLKILDIGGGHGQFAERLLSEFDHSLTILGSHLVCAERLMPWINAGKCEFLQGNFYSLPFPDKSFDVVVCLRQIAHVEDHGRLISEMCRVAKDRVICDYAPLGSFNILYPLLFWLKKFIEKGTRLFLIHSCRDIKHKFKVCGFKLLFRNPQFFWPMGLHRAINKVYLSRFVERIMERTGLTHLFGSPTIVVMIATLV